MYPVGVDACPRDADVSVHGRGRGRTVYLPSKGLRIKR